MAKKRSYKKRKSKKESKPFRKLILLITACFALYFGSKFILKNSNLIHKRLTEAEILERTWINYSHEVINLAYKEKLPADYLLALIVLECSGEASSTLNRRFEKNVYKQLKAVRDGSQSSYGSITKKQLQKASDEALKNLATSWGPFQLMGYQCLSLNINIADIRDEKALYYGVKWINKRYGKYLRNKDFKNGFHIHNAGHPYPTEGPPHTYHPYYVENGIGYSEWFHQKIIQLK